MRGGDGPLLQAIREAGYNVKFVDIQWKRTVVSDWVAELEKDYRRNDPANTILAGFSFGAVTALVAAAKRLPAELWLFSLSPAFDDDRELKHPDKDTLRWVGSRRLQAFAALDYLEIIKHITCKTVVFYGEQEAVDFPELVRHCKLVSQQIPDSRLIEVPGVGHAVDDERYVAAIRSNI
ncbi:MAG TPA: hypothetical protein VGG13_02755 [Candidatus Saccharimonadales bacterium]|jgi:pimeloyl-ACP methyl ester carboxylesterase